MLLAKRVTASTFTPAASSTSYLVTVGPLEKPVTVASISNSLKTALIDATTSSVTSDLSFGTVPVPNRDWSGSL